MDDAEVQSKELKNTGYEIFIGTLSILSIFTCYSCTSSAATTTYKPCSIS